MWLPLMCPLLGTWPATQACALTGNQTSDPFFLRLALNPLSPGQFCCWYVGEGPRGSNGAHSTLHLISVTASTTHNQIGPLWCWFPSGWACAHSRPPWVSPTTSPVSLGVSPAAAPTPTGIFNQGFEALFPRARALGCTVCFALCCSSRVYLCANVGAAGCYPMICLPRSPLL